jgi:hypothetical protein
MQISNGEPLSTFEVTQVETLEFPDLEAYVKEHKYAVNQDELDDGGWSLVDEQTAALLKKIRQVGIPLGDYLQGNIYRGIVTGLNEAFVIDSSTRDKLIAEDPKSAELIKPFLAGKDIKRYQQFKEKLMPKPKDGSGEKWQGRKPGSYKWYEIQDSIDYYLEFEKPKIIYPNICKRPEFAFDESKKYTNQKCFIIPLTDRYLLGILNSSVNFFLFRTILPKLRGDFYEPSSKTSQSAPLISQTRLTKPSTINS